MENLNIYDIESTNDKYFIEFKDILTAMYRDYMKSLTQYTETDPETYNDLEIDIDEGSQVMEVMTLDNDTPIGLAIFTKQSEHKVELNQFYVAEEYRGKTVGKEFLKYMSEYFKSNGITAIDLKVYSENPAMKLYEEEGFKPQYHKLTKSLI